MVTVQIPDEELADVKELTQQANATEAVRAAMQDYIRYARRMQLKCLSGHVHMQDNWREQDATELESRNGDG